MGRLAILFEELDKMDEAKRKCRDCSFCTERSESHGRCIMYGTLVSFGQPVNGCIRFRASKARGSGSEPKAKYGHLKLPKAHAS